jgi:hypothetical protein
MLAFVRDHTAMRALSVLLTLAFLGLSCSPVEEVTRARILLKLPESTDCQPPDGSGRLEVVAAGDFPSTGDTVEVRPIEEAMAMPIRKFPFETRVLTVSLRVDETPFSAGALHERVEMDVEDTLLLLPLGRSCASPDTEIALSPGAAFASLPVGGYVIAGGLDEDSAERAGRRRLVLVPPDEELANIDVELATRRIGATATRSGNRIVIAGGSQFEGSPAEESYEVFDARLGEVVSNPEPLCSAGVCQRRDHGATALADGRVFLVGGVSEPGGAPLGSAVAIDPELLEVDESFGQLITRRRQPFVSTLADGTVVVAGGFTEDGTFVRSVEILDPEERAFRNVAVLPDRSDAAFATLVGGRLVVVGGRGEREDVATVVRFSDPIESVDVALSGYVPLANAQAVALADQRILLVGVDEAGESKAFRVDVGRGVAEERGDPARATDALVSCADGAIAELGAGGVSFRRELLRTPYDNPPDTLFSMDAEWLALDVATSYANVIGGRIMALDDGAPVSLAGLTFADVSVTTTVEGTYRLVFESDEGITRTIIVDSDVVNVDGCEIDRGERDNVTFVRRGSTLDVETDVASGRCSLDSLEGSVRLSVRLASGSQFRAIAVARL